MAASLIQIDWNPDRRELRSFGKSMVIGFAIIAGLLWWWGHPTAAMVCAGVGVALFVVAFSETVVGLWAYRVVMGISFAIGSVVSRVLIAALYYGVITPIALALRATGRDALALKKPAVDSYWVDAPAPRGKESYERQF